MPEKEKELTGPCILCGALCDEEENATSVRHPPNDCTLQGKWFPISDWRLLMGGYSTEVIRFAWDVVEGTQPHTVSVDSLIANLTHLKGMTDERTYTEEDMESAFNAGITEYDTEIEFKSFLQSLQTEAKDA